MKIFLKSLVATVAMASLSVAMAAEQVVVTSPASATQQQTTAVVNELFVIYTEKAVVVKVGSVYRVKLKNPSVGYFTDRPARKVGSVSPENFIQIWNKGKDSFAQDNPNAALVAGLVLQGAVSSQQYVQLSNPKLDVKAKVLSFDLKSIDQAVSIAEGSYKNTVLFVDNFQSDCNATHANDPSCL